MSERDRGALRVVRLDFFSPWVMLPLLLGMGIIAVAFTLPEYDHYRHGRLKVLIAGAFLILASLARWRSPYLLLGAATLVVRPWGMSRGLSEERCWGQLKGLQPSSTVPGPKGDIGQPVVVAVRTYGRYEQDGHKVILRGKDGGILTRFSLRWIRDEDRRSVLHWLKERAA
jgi:hypothetical protein